jgi:hypothetical protein
VRRVVVLLAALALALAGCGGDEGGGSEEEATALLKRGFATDVDTGVLTLESEFQAEGVPSVRGPLRLELEGPFRAAPTPTQVPDLDFEFRASGLGQTYDGRLIITRENAWIEYGGETYEVGEEPWARLVEALGQTSASQPQTLGEAGVDPLDWVEDAETGGEEDVGGTTTTKVSGTLDVEQIVRDVNKLIQDPDQRIPESALGKVDDYVEDVDFEAWIGEDDIWRRISAEATFEVPEDQRGAAGGLEGGRVSLDMRLEEPNQPVEIEGPAEARSIDQLLQQLGIPPELFLGPGFSAPTPG